MANPIVTPAIVETALVTIRGVFAKSAASNPVPHLPLPSEYLDVAVVYGILALVPERFSRVASMVGWGYVVATGLNMAGAFNRLSAKAAAQQSAAATTTGN